MVTVMVLGVMVAHILISFKFSLQHFSFFVSEIVFSLVVGIQHYSLQNIKRTMQSVHYARIPKNLIKFLIQHHLKENDN